MKHTIKERRKFKKIYTYTGIWGGVQGHLAVKVHYRTNDFPAQALNVLDIYDKISKIKNCLPINKLFTLVYIR